MGTWTRGGDWMFVCAWCVVCAICEVVVVVVLVVVLAGGGCSYFWRACLWVGFGRTVLAGRHRSGEWEVGSGEEWLFCTRIRGAVPCSSSCSCLCVSLCVSVSLCVRV